MKTNQKTKGATNVKSYSSSEDKNKKIFDSSEADIIRENSKDLKQDRWDAFQVSNRESNHVQHTNLSEAEIEEKIERGRALVMGRSILLALQSSR